MRNPRRRSPFGDSVRAIALGSRQNLCVNAKVSKLPAARVNEACLDLQKDRKDALAAGCAFLDRALTRGFAASVLVCCFLWCFLTVIDRKLTRLFAYA